MYIFEVFFCIFLINCVCIVSIYAAELYAILLALNELSKQQHKHYLLFSDSLSSLNSIGNKKIRSSHYFTNFIKISQSLFTHSYNIIFRWLPSYVGITGNEKADKAAKSALNNWWLVFTTVIAVVGRVRCLLVVRIMIGAYHCYNRSNCSNVTLFIVFRVCATKAGFSSVSWMNLAVFGCDDNSYPCHSNCHWWKHELSHVAQPNVISVFCWWLFIVINDNVFVCQCLLALLMYYWC